jgi:hypothetical protein
MIGFELGLELALRGLGISGTASAVLGGRNVCKDFIGAESCKWKGMESEIANTWTLGMKS